MLSPDCWLLFYFETRLSSQVARASSPFPMCTICQVRLCICFFVTLCCCSLGCLVPFWYFVFFLPHSAHILLWCFAGNFSVFSDTLVFFPDSDLFFALSSVFLYDSDSYSSILHIVFKVWLYEHSFSMFCAYLINPNPSLPHTHPPKKPLAIMGKCPI